MLIDRLLFSNTVPKAMKKSLDLLSVRQNLISSNIGNLDTPGFKASDLDFQGQLRDALGSKGQLTLKATNDKHFGPKTSNISSLKPEPFEEEEAAKSNGNNVNVDKEQTAEEILNEIEKCERNLGDPSNPEDKKSDKDQS